MAVGFKTRGYDLEKKFKTKAVSYVTTAAAADDMRAVPGIAINQALTLQPRAINTYVVEER